MQSKKSTVLYPIAIVICGLLLSVLISTSKPEPKAQARAEAPPSQVPALLATPADRAITVAAQGTVQPKTEIDLVAQVSGRIDYVAEHFVAGGYFSAGDTMLKIDARDYRIEVVRAQSRLADAQQVLALEQGRARQAKREWRDLGNREANALFLRKPQLAAATAAVEAAAADLEKAQLNLSRTTLSVPFDGYVRDIGVNLGQFVAVGTPLASVFSTDILEVRVPLTDRQVGLMDLSLLQQAGGIDAKVIAEYGGESFSLKGKLVRMEATVDTRSRVRYGIIEVDDKLATESPIPLVVGQFVKAEIAGRLFQNVIAVPLNAMFERNSVLTSDGENRLRITPVKVLQVDGDQAWISGLARDTKVLLKRPGYVIEGMKIDPVLSEVTP